MITKLLLRGAENVLHLDGVKTVLLFECTKERPLSFTMKKSEFYGIWITL